MCYSKKRMSEDQIQSPKENTHSGADAEKPADKPPIAPMNVREPDPQKHTETPKADKKKRKRKPLSCFEIWTIALGSLGILVAAGTGAAIIWQDRIASRTLIEIQKQYPKLVESADAAKESADVEWRTSATTSAAHCLPAVGPRYGLPQHIYFAVTCEDAKVEATVTTCEISAVGLINPRNEEPIGPQQNRPCRKDIIRPNTGTDGENFDIPNFSKGAFNNLTQAVRIKGSFSYNDGFDRIRPVQFCKVLLPFIQAQTGLIDETQVVQLNCGYDLEDRLRLYGEDKKKRQAQKPN